MVLQAVQERVSDLVKTNLPKLCQTGLRDCPQFYLQALVGISLSKTDICLVSLEETIKRGDNFERCIGRESKRRGHLGDVTSDQEKIRQSLQISLPRLCREGLKPGAEFCVEALVGVTVGSHVVLVHVKEHVTGDVTEYAAKESLKPEGAISVKYEEQEESLAEFSATMRQCLADVTDDDTDDDVDDVPILPDEKLVEVSKQEEEESEGEDGAGVVSVGQLDKGDAAGMPKCPICGDDAIGINYGSWTCSGCRAFFRRTLKGPVNFVCQESNSCVISVKDRRSCCQACRYRRCLEAGMSAASGHAESENRTSACEESANDNQDGGGSETDDYEVDEAIAEDHNASDDRDEDFKPANQKRSKAKSAKKRKKMYVRPTKPLHCGFCDYTTVYIATLKRHERSHTGEPSRRKKPSKKLKCNYCDYSTLYHATLKRHIMAHTGEKPARLGKSTTKAANADGEDKPKRGKTMHVCQHCGYTTNHTGSLLRHVRAKHPETIDESDRIFCPQCPDRKLSDKYQLKIHIRNYHHTSLICPCHGQKFVTTYGLKQHIESETGTGRFACTVCGKRLVDRRELRDHMNKHTGERPYQCNFCGKDFSWRSGLRNHLQACKLKHAESMHDSSKEPFVRPYPCTVEGCDKAFFRPGLLKDHIRGVHIGGLYPCPICGKKYSYRDKRDKHMKKTHPPVKEPGEVFNYNYTTEAQTAASTAVTIPSAVPPEVSTDVTAQVVGSVPSQLEQITNINVPYHYPNREAHFSWAFPL